MPNGVTPDAVYTSGDRLWVTASREDTGARLLLSNVGVARPIELDMEELPVDPSAIGITGLDVESVDVPSVSAIPAGPGTPACSSLALWLGSSATAELREALRLIPAAQGLPVLQVMGMVPGKTVPQDPNSAFVDVKPSGKTRPAVAILPPSFDRGREIERALSEALPDAPRARLLCAVPQVTKHLGRVGLGR